MIRLFFDTETTGLPARFGAPADDLEAWGSARLVQLSWIVEMEGEGWKRESLSVGDLIVRPDGFEIPEEASKVHGITTEEALKKGVDLKRAVYYFLGAARMADVVVGHNVEFDLGVVGAELIRTWGKNYLEGMRTVDTMKAPGVAEFCAIEKAGGRPGYKWPKLVELHKKCFGTEFDGAHDSFNDVKATRDCFWALVEKGIIK